MKKILSIITTFSLVFFIVSARPASASINLFGLEIPSSVEEIKNIISEKIAMTVVNTAFNQGETKQLQEQNREAEESGMEPVEIKSKYAGTDSKDIEFNPKKGPTQEVVYVYQSQINDALRNVEGKSYQNYKLSSADVKLGDNVARVSLAFDDGKAVDLILGLEDNGTKIKLLNFDDFGSTKLSMTERLLIPVIVSNGQKLLEQFIPEEANRFQYAKITPERIEIWLVAEKYAE